MGIGAFGLEGVLIGPILVILGRLLFDLIRRAFHRDKSALLSSDASLSAANRFSTL